MAELLLIYLFICIIQYNAFLKPIKKKIILIKGN